MFLDNNRRRQFRQQLENAFTSTTLDLFLQDWLDKKLESIVPSGKEFPMECHLVILWAEREGRLLAFLQAIDVHHENPTFRKFVGELMSTPMAAIPQPGVPTRPYMVNQRPVLDRSTFWQRLVALADGVGGNRVLVVNGGVGKSYSRWPVSHICDPIRKFALLACVDANAGKVVNVDGARLAGLIATRLWGSSSLSIEDGLAQPHRVTKDLTSVIVQRLAALQERTCLIIDELDLVNLDDTAIELLRRLCQAVDGNECPQVWLFLFGLDPKRLGPRVAPFLSVDQVQRPSRQDIEDYLVWFAGTVGKPLLPGALEQAVDTLDAVLLAAPDHSNWDTFHQMLAQKCSGIAQGTVP
ncbi:hypothetical protein [Thauera aminoaromatica]|uniref:Uncharacterized protein n=1 Tax=Thauera aminoaromatica TaxID=164330 RepID=A0A5C7SL66_THASP|nr:hypothetical protein [Thauera aminoaromatica]TXH84363.1 MAG: hypothetical protein E6Q80_11745 [Thauera aminoaromatica]